MIDRRKCKLYGNEIADAYQPIISQECNRLWIWDLFHCVVFKLRNSDHKGIFYWCWVILKNENNIIIYTKYNCIMILQCIMKFIVK